jgi:diguanylate cyclase (GGDEF)-like protein
VVALLGAFADHLPVLIDGLDTTRMTTLTGPIVLPLVVVALVVAVRGAWDRTGPERWVPVAVLACLCDLLLTYASRSRFSLGWYGGRSLTIVATGVVLGAMLVSFRRLKAQAERDAFSDSLTHLTNRRGALAALDFMITPVGRGRSTIGVVALDLDFFKSVNDNDGHAAGDAVLVEVGRVLGSTSRGGDVAARVGGEEFLVILHDTDASGALIAAERLRVQIADMVVPGVGTKVTASIGVTVLEPQDLDPGEVLRRADEALYEAKHNGRNRVESKFLEKLALSKGQP